MLHKTVHIEENFFFIKKNLGLKFVIKFLSLYYPISANVRSARTTGRVGETDGWHTEELGGQTQGNGDHSSGIVATADVLSSLYASSYHIIIYQAKI